MLRLWADFNGIEDQTVWTSLRRKSFVPDGEPWIGQRVELWDHEGNVCQGTVARVNYPIVYVDLDLSTWLDGEAVQIEPRYGEQASFDPVRQGAEERTGVEPVEELAVG
jgi:hypothetical protein